jgi:hypothetical protein
MQTKPISFSLLALFFISVFISLPLQVALLFDYSLVGEISKIFHKLSYLNLALMLSSLICAVYAFKSSPSLKFWLLTFLILTVINNYFVAKLGHDFSYIQTSFASLLCFLVPAFLLMPDGLYALNNPEKCFWMASKRINHESKVELKGRQGVSILAESINLSRTGLLMNMVDNTFIRVGERITLKLPLFKGEKILCEARVVRKTEDQKVALQFESFNLKRFLYIRNLEQSLS